MVNLKLNQPALLYHVNKYCFILELCSQYLIHCHEGTTPYTLVSVFRKGCKPINTSFFLNLRSHTFLYYILNPFWLWRFVWSLLIELQATLVRDNDVIGFLGCGYCGKPSSWHFQWLLLNWNPGPVGYKPSAVTIKPMLILVCWTPRFSIKNKRKSTVLLQISACP